MVHETQLKVRFYELDPYGHVNHTAYFGYFETARVEALEAIGWGLAELKDRGFHLVVVEVGARFHASAVGGDVLTIRTAVTELRRATSRWRQRILRGDDTIATLDLLAAVTDPDGHPRRPPPGMQEDLRKLIADGEDV